MADNSNTLDLGSLRSAHPQTPPPLPEGGGGEVAGAPQTEAPAHQTHHSPVKPAFSFGGKQHGTPRRTDPEHNPQAAKIARERLAQLPSPHPVAHPNALPAMPTADLITDKQALAHRADLAPRPVRRKLPAFTGPLVTALVIFAVVLALFKAPVILSQAKYGLFGATTEQTAVPQGAPGIIPADNTITIPKINVHAPVQYIDSVAEADVQRSLQDGVVHYGTTAKPGEIGNTAIFGHSSNDWWEPGNYKFVFVLLDKLVAGDQITVDYQSKRYVYEVTGSRVVEPTAVEVLNPTSTPTLTLITCSPPGTSLKRLVVTAKQISPAISEDTQSSSTPAPSGPAQLPSSTKGFFEQIAGFWDTIGTGIGSLFGGGSSN